MQTLTFDLVKGALSADSTVSSKLRSQILRLMKSGELEATPTTAAPVKLLRRKEVAERLNVSLRTVDLWATQGILEKVKIPGRQRACGFRSDQVEALIQGDV